MALSTIPKRAGSPGLGLRLKTAPVIVCERRLAMVTELETEPT